MVGLEPSKLIARVQIPAGAFSAERGEAKIAQRDFESGSEGGERLRFKSRPAHTFQLCHFGTFRFSPTHDVSFSLKTISPTVSEANMIKPTLLYDGAIESSDISIQM